MSPGETANAGAGEPSALLCVRAASRSVERSAARSAKALPSLGLGLIALILSWMGAPSPTQAQTELPARPGSLSQPIDQGGSGNEVREAPEETELERVILQLRWFHQFQFAGYYAAEAQGFYRDAGLDVVIRERSEAQDVVQAVLDGEAHYGVTNSELLLRARDGAPILVLAAIFQHSPLVLLAREHADIFTPHDLIGARVKMTRRSRDAELLAMLAMEGIALEQLQLTDGEVGQADYLNPQIDALSAYVTNEPYYLRERGESYHILWPKHYGVDFYGDSLFTSRRELERHPERLEAFLQASLRGWRYAMAHPEEIIALIHERWNPDKSLAHLRYEAETMAELILPDLVDIGYMNAGRWRHIVETYISLGLLPEDFSLEGLLYQPGQSPDLDWLQRALAIILILLLVTGLITAHVITVNRRYRRALADSISANQALASQSRFQSMVTELSTDLIGADLASIDAKIDHFLACVGTFFEVDRSYLFRCSEDLTRIHNTHEWCASGIESFLHRNIVETDALPWWKHQVLTSDYVMIPDVDRLPPEATAERDEFKRQGIQSLLTLPIRVGHELVGFLGFDGVRRLRHWTRAQVSWMAILTNQLAEAELKMRKERELLAAKQRAESATEAKTRFLANMSHEIRTPMNAVIGMVQLALHASPRPEVRARLLHIEQAGRSLLQIINDILDLSKIESGKLELETRPFRLAEVLAYLRSVLAIAAAERTNRVRIESDPAIPTYLVGDALRLGQALLNLAGNAVKFTEHGVIQVRVRLLDCWADRVRLGFWVIDSGIGIDVAQLPMLYDPFWQADSSTTRRYGGSGLGLPITKQLIALMGGEIQVRGRARRGTYFHFEIDFPTLGREAAARLAEEEARHHRPLGERDRARFQGRHLLLVEDHDLNRELTSALLGELGLRPEIAANGREAVDKVIAGDFDLILMDIQMPEMDGFEAARAIRRHEAARAREASQQRDAPQRHAPRAPRVPIIALTAHATANDRARSLAAGMDDHLPKPIDSHQLWQALRRWLPPVPAASPATAAGPASASSFASSSTIASPNDHQPPLAQPQEQALQGLSAEPPLLPPLFDHAAALRRCDGNRHLLHKLIVGFARDHHDAAERLRDQLAANQTRQAERFAHTLKSTAAALELRALSEAAHRLEVALAHSEPRPRIDALLAHLSIRLESALQVTQPFRAEDAATREEPIRPQPSTEDGSTKTQGLDRLMVLYGQIQRNSFSARETLAELQARLGGDLSLPGQALRVAALQQALERLDDVEAAALIEALIADRHA